jgi:hypothetical protein
LVYADDVFIIAKSDCTPSIMFDVVQKEITSCNKILNVNKCCALRVGPRRNNEYLGITCTSVLDISWVSEMRYSGGLRCSRSST